MKNSFLIFLLLFVMSCKKDCSDYNCNCPPCFSEIDDNGNKVAWIPEFRLGKWVNTRVNQAYPDTIIFHNDSIWSNYNEFDGLYEEKYKFVDYRLISYTDASGNPLPPNAPFEFPTLFIDSTCTFHLKRIPGSSLEEWDKYIRVE